MFKKFTAAVVASLSVAFPGAAVAESIEDHQYLWETVQRVGVQTYVNDGRYCNKLEEHHGLYNHHKNFLVVCQDEGRYDGQMVGWSDNDLDTLRHEAHHIVQDCAAGSLYDNEMALLFNDPDDLAEFAAGALTVDQVKWIVSSYGGQGASDAVIVQEIEAFAVAASVNPRTIADKLVEFCL